MRRLFLATVCTLSFLAAAPVAQSGQKRRTAGQKQATRVPTGSQVQVLLESKLDTGQTQTGQTFSGTVAQPIVVGGETVLARGVRVNGRVTEVVSSGRLKRPASITLVLTQASGASLATQPLRVDGKSHLVRNAELIGGGTAAGALIGGLAGGKKGAMVGAGVGAGAGTTTAYMTGKKEIVLPAETLLTFVAASGSGLALAAPAAQERAENARRSSHPSRGGERAGEATPSSRGGREAISQPVFSDRDQQLIRRYYAENTETLPPGLAKRGGNLPPGLERQLQLNGTLPPGLQKRVQPFPDELESRLPRLPDGYTRVYLAGRALILDRNNTILDLLSVRR